MIGRLLLVRHGQAGSLSGEYDVLSELGRQQAEVAAKHWVATDTGFDRVYCGPLKRHRDTAAAAGEVMRAHGLSWGEPELLAELDEHRGAEMVTAQLPGLAERDDDLGRLAWEFATAKNEGDRGRFYLKVFRGVVRLWARGELVGAGDGFESWPDFRTRVVRGLQSIIARAEGARTVVVFTSGGPVAAAVGWVLGLQDEATIELSWMIQNAASTELWFSPQRVSLKSFNATGPLDAAGVSTFI